MGQIKVLVVDDSILVQKVICDIFKKDQSISVIGIAKNGEEALQKIAELHPDVVTMDIEMPKMDGLTAVQKIMDANPLPILMVSALTQRETKITFKALEFGAVDFIPKPSGSFLLDGESIEEELLSKVKTAAAADVKRIKRPTIERVLPHRKFKDKVILIAASTGGPPAVNHVLKNLPNDMPPILVVQHMPKEITRLFAQGLNERCKFQVKEAEEGDTVHAGLALIAPGGFHMVITGDGKVSLNEDPKVNFVRPSADIMMFSAASVFGAKNVGVILTGIGSDGANGVKVIKEKGGTTIAQNQETSLVFGMPKMAIETGCVDVVAPLERIPEAIISACEE